MAVATLKILEQARVLDGDHGLVGEGLQEGNLLVGEGPELQATHQDRADRDAVSDQGRGEDGPNPEPFMEGACDREFSVTLYGGVFKVDRSPVDDRAASH